VSRLDDAELVHPQSRAEWRAWLHEHHATSPGVWMVSFKKSSGRPQVSYEDLVEELLCFGWVDSTARRIDDERSALYVAPRKKGSTWASTNKRRIERLVAAGLMTDAGLAPVEAAKADGSWTLLDAVEALEVPDDLAAAFADHPQVAARYDALGVGGKKQVLWSVVSAKRPETRAARVQRIIDRGNAGEALTP
jgi:uncharacterized protein YdeI (YjbR/CyaY-like superfamily)